MKLHRSSIVVLLAVFGIFSAASAKEKEPQGQKVDSGSFGIFMRGHRVGTETFSITQNSSGSVIQSEFKAEGSAGQALQNSVMQLSPTGELRKYEWKEMSPDKSESTVTPNDQFLMQRLVPGPQEKPIEQPYILPVSTTILDDYFFVHREILAWRYLASICTTQNGQLACRAKQTAKFGTLNPHQRASSPASMEFVGREKVAIRGSEKELNKLELKGESATWMLWLDDNFKLLKIAIPSEETEVVRD